MFRYNIQLIMVLENISIEEHIAALATKSVADRLRVIAAISSGLVEEDTPSTKDISAGKEEVFISNSQDAPVLNPQGEPITLGSTVKNSDNETTGLSLQDLFGAWEDIDKGWEVPIEDNDLFIGATAIGNNLILVTRNTKHFDRLDDIKLENWTKKKHNEFTA